MIDAPVAETIAAAHAAGVGTLVTIGTDIASSRRAVEIARDHAAGGVLATVGIHPNESDGFSSNALSVLAELARDPVVVGIGETGFDHYRQGAPAEVQERSFRAHIELAKENAIALVVHTRDAHPDTQRVLSDAGPPDKLVMHCFSGDEGDAARYLDLGAMLSFAGNVTYKSARDIQRAAAMCPLDRMLVETDAPFLAPVPHRGKPNVPAYVAATGEWLAVQRGIATTTLRERVATNSHYVWSRATAAR